MKSLATMQNRVMFDLVVLIFKGLMNLSQSTKFCFSLTEVMWLEFLCEAPKPLLFLTLNNKLLLNFNFHLSEQRLREMSVVTVSWVFVLVVMFLCEKRILASSCPSVRPHGTARLPLDGFS